MPPPVDQPDRAAAVDVTAVLVAHDGAAWLPEVLAALAGSHCTPGRVVCVDTGSTDTSADLLEAAYGTVVRLPRDTGFGAAVAAGLAAAPPTTWVWLLHDDCAVEPDTLGALLGHAKDSPSAGILGPKVLDWHDPRVLVEVGLTTDSAGHRETGLERREYDQGQHDGVRDVLAVGTAAALVRRRLWDELGGLEPALRVFRDDLDLGWRANAAGSRVVVVPRARVRHVRAATTGRRRTDAAPGRATGTDRRHALFVLLAHASLLRLLVVLPRLLLATALRAAGLLLTRQLPAAGDEVRALAGVLGRPVRLYRARRARARTRTMPQRALRSLFASRSVRLRARAGALGDLLSGSRTVGSDPLGALGDPGPEGPGELDDLPLSGSGTLRRLLLRPIVVLVAALALLALVAERSVLALGGGRLAGGVLLPVPAGARDLWAAYAGAWHPVSVGSAVTATPATGALAVLSSLLFGKPWLAVDVLLLASVPLAAVTAYVASGRLARHGYVRLWAAATWALLPVATGAVAAGRTGPAAVQIGLPLLVMAAGRMLSGDSRVDGWSGAWATGLGIGVLSAFCPLLWPVAAAALLAVALAGAASSGGGRRLAGALIASAVPAAVLLPWSVSAVRHPTLLLGDAAAGPVEAGLAGWRLLLLSPGGPGLPPALLTAGLLLAALGGTLRLSRRRVALAAWGVALLSLAAAAALVRSQARPVGVATAAPVWPGAALQVTAAALLVAALVAARGLRRRLAESSFGWRQLLASLVAVAAAAVPLLTGLSWLQRGAQDPLVRTDRSALPAFAQAELAARPGLRVLLLAPGPAGVRYELTGADGDVLPDASTPPDRRQTDRLDDLVADLLSPRGSDAAEGLSTRAVRYVTLPGSAPDLAEVLDAQPGLVRRTSGSVVLWQVVAPTDRLSVLPRGLARQALAGVRAPRLDQLRATPPLSLPAGPEAAVATLPAGPAGRLLVLADAADPGWRATLAGRPLPRRTAWGWAQAFALPAGGGRLVVRHDQSARHAELGLQGVLLLLAAVLSVPARRARAGLEDDPEDA